MAVRRSNNWLNQQRVDVPHLKSIESAVRSDFDELFNAFAIGEDASYIIRGFEINMTGAIGSSANSLQMIVENSSILHGSSDEAGTFFEIPSGTANQSLNSTTNTRVNGAFTPSALNYVGLEFTRTVDDSTTAQIFLWNPTTDSEISKNVPLAKTLDYEIVITSSIWSSNVTPIAIVETDGSNNVVSVEDRRPMLFRLGTAGSSTPDPFHTYPWTNHSAGRDENFWKSTSSTSPFKGGDKQLLHFKEWADAVMSQLLEIKGTTYWYSDNKGGSLIKMRGDLAHTQMTGNGKFIHAENVAGQINWDSDIFLNFIGSRLKYKINSNASSTNVTLSDDQVAYINIVRGVDISPNLIFTNGSAIVSSVGSVSWTGDIQAGDYIKVGSRDDTHYYQVQSVDSASQVTLAETFKESSTGSAGTQAKYAYGFYEVVSSPSTNRHVQVDDRKDVPFAEDTYWLFLRADNGSSSAKIFIRGSSGGELEQGEDRQISDNQTLDHLDYTGADSEVDTTPDYQNAIVQGVAEQRTLTFPAASSLTSGEYFTINTALDLKKFYVWGNIDGNGGDPSPAGLIPIEVAFNSSDTDVQVASAYATALSAISEFSVTDNGNGTIEVDNAQVGTSTDAANVDMGGTFNINTHTQGAGNFNRVVIDDENLTKGIKRLDETLGSVQDSLETQPYDELIEVISGSPANDNEISGPVSSGTTITIPLNSRNSNAQETYIVGEADLQIYLNGQLLHVGDDYTEVGTSGNESTDVQFTFELKVDDVLEFEKVSAIAGSGGGSGGSTTGTNLGSVKDADVFKQNVGNTMQFRRIAAGSNMSVSQNSDTITLTANPGTAPKTVNSITGVNHTLGSNEDVLLVSNSGSDVTVTLPNASTVPGKVYDIKKIDSGNTLFLKSVSGQELDGVDIDTNPHAISVQYESITIIAFGSNWWII